MKRIIKLSVSVLILCTLTFCYFNTAKKYTTPAPFGEDYTTLRLFHTQGFSHAEISSLRFAAEDMSETVEGAERLWCDAYSRFETVSVSTEDGKSIETPCIVTGGDFFLFHPLEFKSGWYYSDSDLNFDRVVIDERLSFHLFGSNNSEGMKLEVAGISLYVAGVVAMDETKAYAAQLEDKPLIYIPENVAEKIFGTKSFEHYEICLQNPVPSHAVTKMAPVTEGKTVVDATARFSIKNTFSNLREFTTRSFVTEPLDFPYWENEDRGREDTLACLMVLTLVSALFFLIELTLFIYQIRRKK